MDLSSISTPDLQAILRRLPAEIKRREKIEEAAERQAKADCLREIRAKAAAAGLSMVELEALLAADRSASLPVAKRTPAGTYRHPKKPDLIWVNSGKATVNPLWVRKWLDDGGTLEQLRVG